MSVICYFRPGSKRRAMQGDVPAWITNNARAPYILACVLSYPPWVDRVELEALRAEAQRMSTLTGELHVLDHIVPVTNDRVCGLGVPWNFQVVHWLYNARKGNTWCPEQMDLFA